MRLVIPRDKFLSERHQEFAAVVGKHVDLMKSLVDDPDTALRVIGTDTC